MVSSVLVCAILFTSLVLIHPSYSQQYLLSTEGYSIDVYTQRGGIGPGEASEPFKVGELVVLYAEVKNNSVPVEDKPVVFYVYGPPNPYENLTSITVQSTNSSGIASVSFVIGAMGMEHWEERLVGTWLVIAKVLFDPEVFNDSLTFECDWDLTVDLFTQRGGEGFGTPSAPFKAGEVVSLYMRVTNRTIPMPNVFVQFRVHKYPNITYYTAFTNDSGIATVSFRLPWKIETPYTLDCDALMTFNEYAMHDFINDVNCLAGERIVGDLNYDGKVDMKDIYCVAVAFYSYPGHPRWNPECDLNDDGRVDMKDIYLIIKNFGKTA